MNELIELNPVALRNTKKEELELVWIERQSSPPLLKMLVPKQTAQQILFNERLYTEFEGHRVQLWKPNPIRCKKCKQFHHKETICKEKNIFCGKCGENHDDANCKETFFKCTVCTKAGREETNHSVYSKHCMTWIEERTKLNRSLELYVFSS